ncbi:DUF58 domain-containing protein [Lentibacillus lipolyticus]|nr:DUF58 domain-containing protein [Lentibacillus lipolyticus]
MKDLLQFAGKLSSIVFLFLLLFVFAMFQGGFLSGFLFFGFLPIFLYLLALLFYPLKEWEVTREFSRHVVRAGDRVAVTIRIKRSVPFPLYYCVCEEIFPDTLRLVDDRTERYRWMDRPDKLHVPRTIKKIVFPGFRRTIELPYVVEQIPRGEHQLGAVRIRTGDVFGMVTKEHTFHTENRIAAFPNELPVRTPERVGSLEQGSAPSKAIHARNTNIASGIRAYMPGDKFSWIDWKQTAKKNMFVTKEFEQEKSTDTVVVLDACHYPRNNPLAFEVAIELTTSLLGSLDGQTAQTGFLSIGEKTVYFPLTHDPLKKDWIHWHLTSLQPGGEVPFPVRLREEIMQLASGATIILVTPHMDTAYEQVLRQIKKRTKQLIVMFVQASSLISQEEHMVIQQLRSEGIVVNVLTEKELTRSMIEVTLS